MWVRARVVVVALEGRCAIRQVSGEGRWEIEGGVLQEKGNGGVLQDLGHASGSLRILLVRPFAILLSPALCNVPGPVSPGKRTQRILVPSHDPTTTATATTHTHTHT